MRFSEAWLREFVDPPVDAGALGNQLTMAGLELDAMEPAAPPFEKVVVGLVRTAEQHPDADRLRVCQVDAGGGGELLNIVCGAPNVRAGLHVAVALIGAVLPGDFKIKRSKLRGVVSEGMICSARELGLGDEHDGIMELPSDAPLGQSVRDYLGLDDTIIDVDLTPNRGDCLSVLGIAREVSALNRVDRRDAAVAVVPPVDDADAVAVATSAPVACPVYAGRVIRGIRPDARTPVWMTERLRRSGLRPIHPVVDVTNYVMLERGQPMHGFDAARLQGGIDVRFARDGERLELLDGRQVDLAADMLVITDARGPVALAGVMGGAATAVSDDTVDVFFESAFFAPTAIAGRARRLGMHTDASHRFERGVDPAGQVAALERATALLLEIAGGAPGPVTLAREDAALPARPAVALRRQRLDALLGVVVPDALVEEGLARLGLAVEATADGWRVTPPSFRFDIAIEADLIEEVARLYGYDNVPEAPERTTLRNRPASELTLRDQRLRWLMVDRGYQEAITYSFVDPGVLAHFGGAAGAAALANPISADLAVMRPSVVPGLVLAMRQNVARQQGRVRLFEIGPRYQPQADGFAQEKMISGVACGRALPEAWGNDARVLDFFDVKADVEALAALGGREVRFRPAERPGLHPGQCAEVLIGERVAGTVGCLHPAVCSALDLPAASFAFELSVDAVALAALPEFEPVSRFPSIRRDLAVLVPESVSAQHLIDTVSGAAGTLLRQVVLFDEYRGKNVDSSVKSIALGLILQESSRNLTSEEADAVIDRVRRAVEQVLNARIRD